ncbi:hypothetical protein EVAR_10522_1 [Eumeta japonica]|uniref:Uncharacterized protein n=1 Tax=Eumeta variegata TaxID=151549 RepID=A0A4C1THI7_EUMVA|nr:hypothetical protein EVAR_10522_1 [Eumeta japonica]
MKQAVTITKLYYSIQKQIRTHSPTAQNPEGLDWAVGQKKCVFITINAPTVRECIESAAGPSRAVVALVVPPGSLLESPAPLKNGFLRTVMPLYWSRAKCVCGA